MRYAITVAVILAAALSAAAQKSNEAVKKQIRDLKADKSIVLTYDTGAQTTKLMATGPNASDSDAKAANIQAMNFGMALFYPGTSIATPNEFINFTFWVMAKKPRYSGGSHWTFGESGATLDLGDSRYVGKPGDGMEYLNFKLKRTDLDAIATAANPKYKLGSDQYTFTRDQIQLIKNFLAVSDSK